jgi:hypothetical protein
MRGLPRSDIENHASAIVILAAIEIEHSAERSGNLVKGAAFGHRFTRCRINPAKIERVLNEAQDRQLICHRMIKRSCAGRRVKQRLETAPLMVGV